MKGSRPLNPDGSDSDIPVKICLLSHDCLHNAHDISTSGSNRHPTFHFSPTNDSTTDHSLPNH